MSQMTFSDYEYSLRKRKTKREEFLDIMNESLFSILAYADFRGNFCRFQGENSHAPAFLICIKRYSNNMQIYVIIYDIGQKYLSEIWRCLIWKH